jgi:RNA polymerase sigma-70 factor (sigma-E family)
MFAAGRRAESEFESFVEAEGESLRRFAVFLTGDPDEGADLAQEALARAYRHWGRIKSGEPGPYVRGILVNLVRSAHRRSLVRRRHEKAHVPELVVAAESGRVNDWIVMREALQRLRPVVRASIVLRFYEDMPLEEIARVLDRPLGTVKSDLHRGMAQLRRYLTAERKQA